MARDKVSIQRLGRSFVAKVPKGEWTVIARNGEIKAAGLGTSKGGSVGRTCVRSYTCPQIITNLYK